MPKSPAVDIGQHLLAVTPAIVTLNRSLVLPVLTVGVEPEIPNKVLVTLYDTPGPPANPAYQRDYPRIQVRVKGEDPFGYSKAYDTQQAIKDILLGMSRVTINSTLYVGVWQQIDIASLASDYNNRPVLVSTYRMVREYSTPNRLPIE